VLLVFDVLFEWNMGSLVTESVLSKMMDTGSYPRRIGHGMRPVRQSRKVCVSFGLKRGIDIGQI